MKNFFLNYWPQILLLCIGIVICIANYTPNTFLSGWDTLHPEFNFPLAFSRAFFGVFQSHEGVGAVAAHSVMADLPHILLLSLLSLLIPLSLLRYLFIFLCFIAGGLGMYSFLRHLIPSKPVCFIGAFFYMCNIGTVQNFYVPFEMFVVQYAALPFLFLFATDFLITKNRKSLIFFVVTVILASPMAYAATLWYVTYGVFLSYVGLLSYLMKSFKKTFLLTFIMLLLNLYWILPNIYFVLYHGKEVQQALTNQLFSEEAFLYNKSFGNFFDIASLHTFYFAWSMYANHAFSPLMQVWSTYLATSVQKFLALLFFSVTLAGLGLGVYKKKKIFLSFIPAIGICLLFLFNDNLPFHVYGLLGKIPLFQEAFRFPDDKILGIYTFIYSLFFSFGIYRVINSISRNFKPTIMIYIIIVKVETILYLLFSTLILVSAFPVFQGQLISPSMRVTIPSAYFQLFSYLATQPQGRIITLPIQYLWGWEYYDWSTHPTSYVGKLNYQGSGFMSFGIPQATMDRDFDRWNSSNETYYREMSYAIYTENAVLLREVLAKYNISSVLLDSSVVDPTERKSALWYPQTQKLLQRIGLTPITFGNHLFLYTINNPSQSVVAFQDSLPTKPKVISDVVDKNFLTSGDYTIYNTTADFSLNHLGEIDHTFPIAKNSIPFASYHLALSPFLHTISTSFNVNDCESNPFFSHTGPLSWSKQIYFGFIQYTSQNGSLCDHMSFPYPLDGHNYILQITARNLTGLSLRVCVSDPVTGKCIVYSKLPTNSAFQTYNMFIPAFSNNKRFSVNINTIGIPGTTSINDVKDIRILTAPMYTPTVSPATVRIPLAANSLANNSIITLSSPAPRIGLFEAYDPGWQLYQISNNKYPISNIQIFLPFLFGKPVGQHIEVDNWANGWDLTDTSADAKAMADKQSSMVNDQFVIIFLPQYLEYLGFLIGGITMIMVAVKNFRTHTKY